MLPKVTKFTISSSFIRQLFFNNAFNQKTIIACTLVAACILTVLSTSLLVAYPAYSAESNASIYQKNIHTRTLASSCAACHGTQGNSLGITPVLAGLDATYFITKMLAFRTSDLDSTVMHHHARGLTIDEINALANYFSIQKRTAHPAAKSQTLKARDE